MKTKKIKTAIAALMLIGATSLPVALSAIQTVENEDPKGTVCKWSSAICQRVLIQCEDGSQGEVIIQGYKQFPG